MLPYFLAAIAVPLLVYPRFLWRNRSPMDADAERGSGIMFGIGLSALVAGFTLVFAR